MPQITPPSAPVRLVAHRPIWRDAFSVEAARLRAALTPLEIELHHIGSTAVPGLIAKPIIDLMGAAVDLSSIDARAEAIRTLGYEAMGAFGITGRRFFRRVEAGVRTHHLHVYAAGSPHLERYLAFRDYLRAHPDAAATYASVKRRAAAGAASRVAYAEAKAAFVEDTERRALVWARAR